MRVCETTAAVGAFILLLAGDLHAADVALPPGVTRVAMGQAVRAKDPSHGDTCTIPIPLPSPAEFTPGVTEIAYIVEIDAGGARQVRVSVVGDLGTTETKGTNCNAYSICGGRICQTRFGSTLARTDGKALKPGSYSLSIEVDGKRASVPFTIK